MFKQLKNHIINKKTSKHNVVPIFIISFNRKWQLERSLASYQKLKNTDIIIHDNGSDDPEVVAYLKKLESEGVVVNYCPKISDVSELIYVNDSIKKYFSSKPASNYIVTDPDIELLPNAENTLNVYEYMLKKYPDIESVGPMLKIDDIAKDYPLYHNVLNRHIEQFWGKKPTVVRYKGEKIAYLFSTIDTSFAMHRKDQNFKRLTSGMRLYGKYSARHLDWYRNNISNDPYFKKSNSSIAHWGNATFHDEFKNDKVKYKSYFDVESTGKSLKIIEKRISK